MTPEEIPWKPIDAAPRSGLQIVGNYGPDGYAWIYWSERPVCMLGPVNGGHKPGWATGPDTTSDFNLPMDPPESWCYEEEFGAATSLIN